MAWLAVDRYEDEYIFECKPKKVGHRKCDDFDDLTHYTYDGVSIELPKGTIEKIIGRKLTWKDAPVEI